MKKIIFPFYKKGRHDFLVKKWFFRLLIVLYIVGMIAILFGTVSYFAQSAWGWCYDSATSSILTPIDISLSEHLNYCGELMDNQRMGVWAYSIILTLIIHYLVQFVFFQIIINFIVLGSNKDKSL